MPRCSFSYIPILCVYAMSYRCFLAASHVKDVTSKVWSNIDANSLIFTFAFVEMKEGRPCHVFHVFGCNDECLYPNKSRLYQQMLNLNFFLLCHYPQSTCSIEAVGTRTNILLKSRRTRSFQLFLIQGFFPFIFF